MDNASNRIPLNRRSRISRSFDGGKFYETPKDEELRMTNLRNPRPILHPERSLRKSHARNFAPSGLVSSRKDGISVGVAGLDYGYRKQENHAPKLFCGAVNSKSSIENRPQISNMTSMGLMNAIKHSPSNQMYNKPGADIPMTSQLRQTVLQQPTNYFYREYQSKFLEPSSLLSSENRNVLNEIRPAHEKLATNSFTNDNFSTNNMELTAKQRIGSKKMGAYLRNEDEVTKSDSESTDYSFGSMSNQGTPFQEPVLQEWQTEKNLKHNYLYSKDIHSKEEPSTFENQTLMQDFKLIAVFGYEKATSIMFFLVVALLIWTCLALVFEVVPFSAHYRNSLSKLLSYKKPEPKYAIVIWMNKVIRLIGKMTRISCGK